MSAILDKPQTVASSVGAAFGDAAIAAYAVGNLTSRSEILNWVGSEAQVGVNRDMQSRLQIDHEDYKALYEATRALGTKRSLRARDG